MSSRFTAVQKRQKKIWLVDEGGITTEPSESVQMPLYCCLLKDAAFVELLPEIVAGKEDVLLGTVQPDEMSGLGRKNLTVPCVVAIGLRIQREVVSVRFPSFIESNSSKLFGKTRRQLSFLGKIGYEAT